MCGVCECEFVRCACVCVCGVGMHVSLSWDPCLMYQLMGAGGSLNGAHA